MDVMIHGYIIQRRFKFHFYVTTGIINMYAKYQSVKIAHGAFDKMPNHAVSWNAMVTGYAENGHASEALTLFHQTRRVGMKPDSNTMLRVLPEMCPFGLALFMYNLSWNKLLLLHCML
jgi:pentatricopeptide repeat protein